MDYNIPFDLLPILGTALIATLVPYRLERSLLHSPLRGEWGIGVLLLFALLCLADHLGTTSASDLGESRSDRPGQEAPGPATPWRPSLRPHAHRKWRGGK
ncbi:MAG: hypothetical protein U9R05_08505 [Chloroflexota bacterium]|nr:hypothetical protein [Chloroflexota bacterium]